MSRDRYIFNCKIISCLVFVLTSIVSPSSHPDSHYEETVIESIKNIQDLDIDSPLDSINNILENYPNSKIGHLILADLLAAKAGSKRLIENYAEDKDQLNGLRDELRYRWQHIELNQPASMGKIPGSIIQLSNHQEHIIVVDASKARLYIFKHTRGQYQLVDHYYMTVGKSGMGKSEEGDLRTPIGVYAVTSYIPGETLPPRYGPGAYPINYPNKFDRLQQRTGYGIWIHGTEPDNYNRVPLASDGCVSLSNDEFIAISRYITTDGNTPVLISTEFQWMDQNQINAKKLKFNQIIGRWISDWESRDPAKYLKHYSKHFKTESHTYSSWSEHKSRINPSKEYIKVEIDNLSIFNYPGEENMVMMSFNQDYQSNNYSNQSTKTMYWKKNANNEWKIIYEG